MDEEIILEILKSDKLVIDFLEYNNVDLIIDKILKDENLYSELKKIPKSFWLNAIKNGLLVYSDYTCVTRNNKEEAIDYKYHEFFYENEQVPALVYQKKKKVFY